MQLQAIPACQYSLPDRRKPDFRPSALLQPVAHPKPHASQPDQSTDGRPLSKQTQLFLEMSQLQEPLQQYSTQEQIPSTQITSQIARKAVLSVEESDSDKNRRLLLQKMQIPVCAPSAGPCRNNYLFTNHRANYREKYLQTASELSWVNRRLTKRAGQGVQMHSKYKELYKDLGEESLYRPVSIDVPADWADERQLTA